MDSSVSPKDEIWFLRVCHHISNAVYNAGWPFPGEPGSDHAVPTPAAMHSVMAL